jgi:hypothetical protein
MSFGRQVIFVVFLMPALAVLLLLAASESYVCRFLEGRRARSTAPPAG